MEHSKRSEDFKFKGTFLIATKEFIGKKYGNDYAFESIAKYYPNMSILASSWYPASPLIDWLKAISIEQQISFRELILSHTKFVMEKDLNGVYKFFMKLGGTKRVLNSLPQLAKSYSNWNNAKIIINEDNYAKVISEVPSEFQEFMLFSSEGAMNGIINVCGQILESFNIISHEIVIKNGISYSKIIFEFKYK